MLYWFNSRCQYILIEIVNNVLLAGDKFTPQIHLKHPGFTYTACSLFTKNKEKIKMYIQTRNTNTIYRNDLDKVCFQHDWLILTTMVWLKEQNLIKF